MKIIDIIPTTRIPLALPQILSYFSATDILPGALVEIPLGRRKETGVVIDCRELSDYKQEVKKAGFEMRNISKIISTEPVLTKEQIKLALWAAKYYWASPGIFLKMCLPSYYSSSKAARFDEALARRAGRVEKLKKEILDSSLSRPRPELGPKGAQSRDSNNKYGQRLILYPTIPSLLATAENYSNAIVWHSGLTQKEMRENRQKIRSGQAKAILGARSALFLPFLNLKEIIIEDETNSGHKSWDMFPHYRAREIAQKLAEIFGAKLSLHSNVPSVEMTFLSSKSKITPPPPSPSKWEGENKIPPIPPFIKRGETQQTALIDMREEIQRKNFSIFSETLQQEIAKTLIAKKQIILFINRRGAANFVLCRDCGYVANCSNCEAPLAHHLISNKPTLLCHRCNHQENPPGLCPKCQSYRIKTVGIGTQKVELEAQKFFPEAKIARLDSDIAPDAKAQEKIVETLVKKEIDILISTQILFSWVDKIKSPIELIALISADTLLHLPDFRSGERTWQIIARLKEILAIPPFIKGGLGGISTTSQNPPQSPFSKGGGKLIIQTYNPKNQVLKYAAKNDWQKFYNEEIETRQILGYPPFSQIVKLIFRHRDPQKAGLEAKILAKKLQNIITKNSSSVIARTPTNVGGRSNPVDGGNMTGSPRPSPARCGGRARDDNFVVVSAALPAFIPKENGKYVWNIIIKFSPSAPPSVKALSLSPPFIKGGLGGIFTNEEFFRARNSLLQYVPSNWEIDVDPENLL